MKETSPHVYSEAIHCTQEKGEGPKEGVAAPGPGLLIHILLPSIHILRGLHPKQPSERVGGTHSLANNSPRNRKRNLAGIEKTPLTRQRGGGGRVASRDPSPGRRGISSPSRGQPPLPP